MTGLEYERLKVRIMNRLRAELPGHLHYHCPEHTERVLIAAEYIAIQEKIRENDLLLLKIAVLYHDIGFLISGENHEAEGKRIAREELTAMGMDSHDIDIICGMIEATKIPQVANTRLEHVMADADLEYLGTDDFDPISHRLFLEIRHNKPDLSMDEWNRIQIKFLEKHSYFTQFGKIHLEPVKQEHLKKLKASVDGK